MLPDETRGRADGPDPRPARLPAARRRPICRSTPASARLASASASRASCPASPLAGTPWTCALRTASTLNAASPKQEFQIYFKRGQDKITLLTDIEITFTH